MQASSISGDIYLGSVPSPRTADPPLPYDRNRPVFVQYLNPEILACYGRPIRFDRRQLSLDEAVHATRTAILATDANLIIPASYLFEVGQLTEIFRELFESGLVSYCSAIGDVSAYREQKLTAYRDDKTSPYAIRARRETWHDLPWVPRRNFDTCEDIEADWASALDPRAQLHRLSTSIQRRLCTPLSDVDRQLREVPERLEGRAFITRFVTQVLPLRLTPRERLYIDLFISRSYLRSYLDDTDATLLTEFPFGELSCGLDGRRDRLASAFAIDLALRWLGVHDYVHRLATWPEVLRLRAMAEFGFVLEHSQTTTGRRRLRAAVVACRRGGLGEVPVRLADAMAAVETVATRLTT